jgi:hypothetical protein
MYIQIKSYRPPRPSGPRIEFAFHLSPPRVYTRHIFICIFFPFSPLYFSTLWKCVFLSTK